MKEGVQGRRVRPGRALPREVIQGERDRGGRGRPPIGWGGELQEVRTQQLALLWAPAPGVLEAGGAVVEQGADPAVEGSAGLDPGVP